MPLLRTVDGEQDKTEFILIAQSNGDYPQYETTQAENMHMLASLLFINLYDSDISYLIGYLQEINRKYNEDSFGKTLKQVKEDVNQLYKIYGVGHDE